MGDSHSLFLSPEFILTESSFIVVASIAAYEILIGDFIWAQQEEEAQSNRGRAGYGSVENNRQPQSPGSRGRGPRPSSSRRGSNEETALLYPPRTSRADYSSPGDARFASTGRGSPGDSTRRLVSLPFS